MRVLRNFDDLLPLSFKRVCPPLTIWCRRTNGSVSLDGFCFRAVAVCWRSFFVVGCCLRSVAFCNWLLFAVGRSPVTARFVALSGGGRGVCKVQKCVHIFRSLRSLRKVFCVLFSDCVFGFYFYCPWLSSDRAMGPTICKGGRGRQCGLLISWDASRRVFCLGRRGGEDVQ